jgi:hypothetical protein
MEFSLIQAIRLGNDLNFVGLAIERILASVWLALLQGMKL